MNEAMYLKSLNQLEPKCRIYIYGSGMFGRSFFHSVKAYSPDG
tara:strand:+ start:1667 stop:1795 length:129 start_codon:yes stop_codon:yes gene_type:complete